jgi:glycerophosphoryl diester phosphodiesterase
MGADGVELDVTLTKDNVPIIIHDDTVDRTTNGHGAIKEMTLAEVKQLDASYKFDKYRDETLRVPTLHEVLSAVGKRGIVNIEIKSTTLKTDGVEAAVLAVIEDTGAGDHVMISSFNPLALSRMAELDPRLPRGLLYANNLPLYLRRAWLRPIAKPTAMHPHCSMIDDKYVAWARSKGYKINTWTTDDPVEMQRLMNLGVDAIMTNKPDVLRQVVGS